MAEQQSFTYTCLSCSIAFTNPEEQREHYRSEHHRYNMKRRVANLPPVSVAIFNEKVLERRPEKVNAQEPPKSTICTICSKVYTSENSYRSHLNSKKHKDNELKAAIKLSLSPDGPQKPQKASPRRRSEDLLHQIPIDSLHIDENVPEEELKRALDERIAAVRSRITTSDCLFCSLSSETIEENLTHMSSAHSFFIPDAAYLVDLPGLIVYLAEKILIGNICLYCNGRGKEFRSLDAVRKHMIDKSHCKIAYDSEKDQLDISDYYDFTSSYPAVTTPHEDDSVWEDVEDDGESGDDVLDVDDSDVSESTQDDIPPSQVTYGDSEFELVLPSGVRIGHRSLKRYYDQNFRGSRITPSLNGEDPKSGAALVRRLLADRNAALVPRKGGFGAFGLGTDVVKARNPGEAREAGRHIREFRDQKRREDFKTKMAYINNNQKHFRDPLLQ